MDQLIDRSLRAQVVISVLDPKGLAIFMREMDVTQAGAPSEGSVRAGHSLDSTAEMVTTSVLADVAEGTGGEFFHNKNDLKTGFGALGGSAVSYILAFAPDDIKPDGKFHPLKVTLKQSSKPFQFRHAGDISRPARTKYARWKRRKSAAPVPNHQCRNISGR